MENPDIAQDMILDNSLEPKIEFYLINNDLDTLHQLYSQNRKQRDDISKGNDYSLSFMKGNARSATGLRS